MVYRIPNYSSSWFHYSICLHFLLFAGLFIINLHIFYEFVNFFVMQNLSLPDFIPNVTFLKGFRVLTLRAGGNKHALCTLGCVRYVAEQIESVVHTESIYWQVKNNFISFLFHLFLFLFFLSFILIFRKYIYNITVLKAIIFLFLQICSK